jgi:UDP-N-acetyl-D-glucosamine dehydrogenase
MAVKGARVLILGVSYKADVGDVRESPALRIMGHLHRRGARIAYHDPYVAEVQANGGRFERTELSNAAVASADCVAILTPHRTYDLDWVAEHATLVFDARNAYSDTRRPNVVRL